MPESASVDTSSNCAVLSAVVIVVPSFMVAPAPISLAVSLALVSLRSPML